MGSYIQRPKDRVIDAIYNEDTPYLKTELSAINKNFLASFINSPIPDDTHGRAMLHIAAWSDDPELLTTLLDYNCDVNVRDVYGWTPLMVCIYKGNIHNVYALLQKSAHFDPESNEATWLLYHSVHHDIPAVVSILLEKSTRMDDPTRFLMRAVDNCSLNTTKMLLEKGKCDPNQLDFCGYSALHIACGHNNLPLFRLLVENGADINLRDSAGNTPLAWAVQYDAGSVKGELENKNATKDDLWHEVSRSKSQSKTDTKSVETEGNADLYYQMDTGLAEDGEGGENITWDIEGRNGEAGRNRASIGSLFLESQVEEEEPEEDYIEQFRIEKYHNGGYSGGDKGSIKMNQIESTSFDRPPAYSNIPNDPGHEGLH